MDIYSTYAYLWMSFGTDGMWFKTWPDSWAVNHAYYINVVSSARTRSEGYGSRSVCLSVCLSLLTTFSATTRNKPAKKRQQQVQRYTGFILKMAMFVKLLRSRVMAWKPSEQANMLISTGLPRPGPLALCILKAQKVTTKGVYRLPHAIYYCR